MQVIPIAKDALTLPSVVAFLKDGSSLIGSKAKRCRPYEVVSLISPMHSCRQVQVTYRHASLKAPPKLQVCKTRPAECLLLGKAIHWTYPEGGEAGKDQGKLIQSFSN